MEASNAPIWVTAGDLETAAHAALLYCCLWWWWFECPSDLVGAIFAAARNHPVHPASGQAVLAR